MSVHSNPLRVALYARVSSEQQAQEGTIDSQVTALCHYIQQQGYTLCDEDCFIDDGYSGTTLARPALEQLRDSVAQGSIDRLYVHSPDRLARKLAHQAVLLDEFSRLGLEVVFVNRPLSETAEDEMLVQMQGVIAEYERSKTIERCRRGRLHNARQGRISALSVAPYGYRYVSVHEGGGEARYEVNEEQAAVIGQIFAWVGRERISLGEVCRRLENQGVLTAQGKKRWNVGTVRTWLGNPAYKGEALYGKSRLIERRPRLRTRRGAPEIPRRDCSVTRQGVEPIPIAVPALVSEELFSEVAEQLEENRRRYRKRIAGVRYLLQGLLVCRRCGYACCGQPDYPLKLEPTSGHFKGKYRCCTRLKGKRRAGGRECSLPPIRVEELDEAVWQDVVQLLSDPGRLEAEYHRRLQSDSGMSPQQERVTKRLAGARRGISRLIDAYSEGLVEKEEFEPKIRELRERKSRLEEEEKQLANEEKQRRELRLVIGHLEEFRDQMAEGFEKADWSSRREIIRCLVNKIEVGDEEIHMVYRVSTAPIVRGSDGGILQHCWKRYAANERH